MKWKSDVETNKAEEAEISLGKVKTGDDTEKTGEKQLVVQMHRKVLLRYLMNSVCWEYCVAQTETPQFMETATEDIRGQFQTQTVISPYQFTAQTEDKRKTFYVNLFSFCCY